MTDTINQLLWVDLETTGLSTLDGRDEIIEIACILTTTELDVMGEFTSPVKPSKEALVRLANNDYVWNMHTKNGLIKDLDDAPSISSVEVDIFGWLGILGAADKLTLAGSGVGPFDLPALRLQMPALAGGLDYWVIDVGVLRRAHALWVGTTVSEANDSKTHRALDDVRCHLDDGKAFRELWLRTQTGS